MNIETMLRTMTTAQAVTRLRKTHSDKDIILGAMDCPRGIREAINTILEKQVASDRYSSEEREVTESEKDYYE